jgi:hypothetical protein
VGVVTYQQVDKGIGLETYQSKLEKYLGIVFEIMAIMANCSFFTHIDVKKFELKFDLIKLMV